LGWLSLPQRSTPAGALGEDKPLGLLAYALLAIAIAVGLVLSALLHGFYDFLVLLNPTAALPLAAVLIISIWIWRLILMRRLHRNAVDKTR